jgi:hypothetical protein
MTSNELTGRFIRSQQLLWGYRSGSPTGALETTLSLIGEEIDALGDLALASPEFAVKLDVLADQWRELSDGLKGRRQ